MRTSVESVESGERCAYPELLSFGCEAAVHVAARRLATTRQSTRQSTRVASEPVTRIRLHSCRTCHCSPLSRAMAAVCGAGRVHQPSHELSSALDYSRHCQGVTGSAEQTHRRMFSATSAAVSEALLHPLPCCFRSHGPLAAS